MAAPASDDMSFEVLAAFGGFEYSRYAPCGWWIE